MVSHLFNLSEMFSPDFPFLFSCPGFLVFLAMAVYTGVTINYYGKRYGNWRFSWSYIIGWVSVVLTFFSGEYATQQTKGVGWGVVLSEWVITLSQFLDKKLMHSVHSLLGEHILWCHVSNKLKTLLILKINFILNRVVPFENSHPHNVKASASTCMPGYTS